ncbi:MAG: nucleotide exchange factor GrpE [Thainema sp.]
MARTHIDKPEYDCSEKLRSRMQTVGLSSFRALAEAAGVSNWQVRQLRRGNVSVMRLAALQKLSQALNLSLPDFLQQFTDELSDQSSVQTAVPTSTVSATSQASPTAAAEPDASLKREYERLQRQLETQKSQLEEAFQRESLQQIESWLTFWPTAVRRVQENPDDIPIDKLLLLLRPIDKLLESWGVSTISEVDAEIPYDPQQHQLMNGDAEPGDLVKVRNVGYRHGDRLLHRAKVSPK